LDVTGVWLEGHAGVPISATWYASALTTDAAVLIVSSVGQEERSISLSVPSLAQSLAGHGLPSFMIDLAGSNQSIDQPQDDVSERWIDAVAQGAQFLRSHGARRLGVVATRLGCLISLSALARHPADALVLLSPAPSGRRLVREMKMIAQASHGGFIDPSGAISVGGYLLAADVVRSISKLDLDDLNAAPANHVRYVESSDRTFDTKLIDQLRELGSDVATCEADDIGEWLFAPTDAADVPHTTMSRTALWMRDHLLAEQGPGCIDPRPLTTEARFAVDGVPIRESFVRVGPPGLSGVLAEPDVAPSHSVALLYLSTVGPGRRFVEGARKAATNGWTSLRMDFAGFGSSPLHPGQRDAELYGPLGAADIQTGVDYLIDRGAKSVIVVGYCAGAWSALSGGVMAGVSGVVAVNVQLFAKLQVSGPTTGSDHRRRRHHGKAGKLALKAARRVRGQTRRSAEPVRWLSQIARAGVTIELHFDDDDDGLRYWRSRLEPRLLRECSRREIVLTTYHGLGHLLEGVSMADLLDANIMKFACSLESSQDSSDR
jgi:pimeloyl-ACP methyl ester carboxylesterase